jgi:hypothetical protein
MQSVQLSEDGSTEASEALQIHFKLAWRILREHFDSSLTVVITFDKLKLSMLIFFRLFTISLYTI